MSNADSAPHSNAMAPLPSQMTSHSTSAVFVLITM